MKLYMKNFIADHPVIQNCERTGYPDNRDDKEPTCPICGRECEYIYRSMDTGEILGCDMCVERVDAWEVTH